MMTAMNQDKDTCSDISGLVIMATYELSIDNLYQLTTFNNFYKLNKKIL